MPRRATGWGASAGPGALPGSTEPGWTRAVAIAALSTRVRDHDGRRSVRGRGIMTPALGVAPARGRVAQLDAHRLQRVAADLAPRDGEQFALLLVDVIRQC